MKYIGSKMRRKDDIAVHCGMHDAPYFSALAIANNTDSARLQKTGHPHPTIRSLILSDGLMRLCIAATSIKDGCQCLFAAKSRPVGACNAEWSARGLPCRRPSCHSESAISISRHLNHKSSQRRHRQIQLNSLRAKPLALLYPLHFASLQRSFSAFLSAVQCRPLQQCQRLLNVDAATSTPSRGPLVTTHARVGIDALWHALRSVCYKRVRPAENPSHGVGRR